MDKYYISEEAFENIFMYLRAIKGVYFPWAGYKPSSLGGIALAGMFAL